MITRAHCENFKLQLWTISSSTRATSATHINAGIPRVVSFHHSVGDGVGLHRYIASNIYPLEIHSNTECTNAIKEPNDKDLLVIKRRGILPPEVPSLCHNSTLLRPFEQHTPPPVVEASLHVTIGWTSPRKSIHPSGWCRGASSVKDSIKRQTLFKAPRSCLLNMEK